MFITPAYAQSFGDGASGVMQIAPLVLIFVVFYFFLIRPQQTKAKQHKSMLEALRRGDRIVTGGGIIGSVAKVVSDQEVMVDIADNVRVRILRSTISSVLAKPEPVAAKETGKDAAKDGGAKEPAETEAKTPETIGAGWGDNRFGSVVRRLIGGK